MQLIKYRQQKSHSLAASTLSVHDGVLPRHDSVVNCILLNGCDVLVVVQVERLKQVRVDLTVTLALFKGFPKRFCTLQYSILMMIMPILIKVFILIRRTTLVFI